MHHVLKGHLLDVMRRAGQALRRRLRSHRGVVAWSAVSERLLTVGGALSAATDLRGVADVVLGEVLDLDGVAWAALTVVDRVDGDSQSLHALRGRRSARPGSGPVLPVGADLEAARAGHPVWLAPEGGRRVGEAYLVPVPAGERATMVLVAGCAPQHRLRAADLAAVEAFAALAGPLTALAARVQSTTDAALRDELTGLWNRRALRRAMEMRRGGRRTDAPTAVVVLDCDGLKAVNDGHGHAAGDDVIRAVGRSLRACLRAGDIAARTGGDEFVVLLPGAGDGPANDAIDRVRAALAAELEAAGAPAVRLSAGVAIARPGEDLLDAQHRADEAMYTAKRSGGGVAVAPRARPTIPRPPTRPLVVSA